MIILKTKNSVRKMKKMKKLIFTSILLLSLMTKAQIKTITSNIVEEPELEIDFEIINLNKDGYKLLLKDNGSDIIGPAKTNKTANIEKIEIYNFDKTLFKEIDLSTLNIEGVILNISQNIVNNDDNIEIMIDKGNDGSGSLPSGNGFIIVNENLEILFEIDGWRARVKENNYTSYITYPFSTYRSNFLIFANNKIKLLLEKTDQSSGETRTKVFNLGGTFTLKNETIGKKNIETLMYPNPSKEYVNLKYQLPKNINNPKLFIYNVNGALTKEIDLNEQSEKLRISTREFSSGIYFYKIKSNNYESKTKKIILE